MQMPNHRLAQLVTAIRSRPYLPAPKPELLDKEQLVPLVRELWQHYDTLLGQCHHLAGAVEQHIHDKAVEYDSIVEELEHERSERKAELLEYERSMEAMTERLGAQTRLIQDREEEVEVLRAALEEREGCFNQLEQDERERISIVNSHHAKTVESLETQRIQIEHQTQQKLTALRQQNRQYLAQNTMLSQRIEQLLHYIDEIQQCQHQGRSPSQKSHPNQLSPKLIQALTQDQHSPMQEQQDSVQCSSQRSHFRDIEDKSCTEEATSRLVLREILNTEDRKSDNYGWLMGSKDRPDLQGSNDENNYNAGNMAAMAQGEKGHQEEACQRVQEFETGECGLDPYRIFFTLIGQCAKIDSPDMERASQVDLGDMWMQFMEERVPLHEWYGLLRARLGVRVD